MSAHVPVTAEELAEIARLHAAATEGEWGAFEDTADESWSVASDGYAVFSSHGEHVVTQADAEFAELCHEVVPRLARDLAERTAERDAAQKLAAERGRILAAVDEELHAAGAEVREGETWRARVLRALGHRCEAPGCNKPADGVTCSEECSANFSEWLSRNERAAERDALAATVERLIREAGDIRNDERQRAKAEHEALADEGRQRDANRIERLEGELARLRVIVDDADRAKAEHAATRDELRRLHDVLSGERPLTK